MGRNPVPLLISRNMIKTYKANTCISINIVLPSKSNLHISFIPLSNGGSTFTTDSQEIMEAIERHYNFGKLFRLDSTQGEGVPEQTEGEGEEKNGGPENKEQGKQSVEEKEEENAGEKGLKKVPVSDYATAKDYLADTFGISRTALRGPKAILEHAAARGIEFVGL